MKAQDASAIQEALASTPSANPKASSAETSVGVTSTHSNDFTSIARGATDAVQWISQPGHRQRRALLGLMALASTSMGIPGTVRAVEGLEGQARVTRDTKQSSIPGRDGALAETSPWLAETGSIDVTFEPNRGQSPPEVRYLARGRGLSVFATETEVAMAFAQKLERDDAEDLVVPAWLRMALVGAQPIAPIAETDTYAVSNYFVGADPRAWRLNIPQSEGIRYPDVLPGVDLIVRVDAGRVLLRLELEAGVDPSSLALQFRGLEDLSRSDLRRDGTGSLQSVRADQNGGVELRGSTATAQLAVQRVTQDRDGKEFMISGSFVTTPVDPAEGSVSATRRSADKSLVHFAPGSYDASLPMRIDAVLGYSSRFGGSADEAATSVAVDSAGNAYISGMSWSANYPTTTGSYDPTFNGSTADAFVTKLNTSGSQRVYSTYLGGSAGGSSGYTGWDTATGLAVDAYGSLAITGYTYSTNFPVSSGCFQPKFAGGNSDMFVAKLDATGAKLVYSTYLGGADSDSGEAIVLGADGAAFVTGYSYSANYPVTSMAYQRSNKGWADAVVTKLTPTGSALSFSTYLGGSAGTSGSYGDFGKAIALSADGSVVVAGHTLSLDFPSTSTALQTTRRGSYDAFVSRLSATGESLLYSSYVGGAGMEVLSGLAVDRGSNVWLLATTTSTDAPVSGTGFQRAHAGGTYDAWLTRIDTARSGTASLVFGTYLGGSAADYGKAVRVDANNTAFVVGATQSLSFPVTSDALQRTYRGGEYDAYFTRISATGASLLHSTFVGGSAYDYGVALALDKKDRAYLTGVTNSGDFVGTSTSSGATGATSSRDLFITRMDLATTVSQREDMH